MKKSLEDAIRAVIADMAGAIPDQFGYIHAISAAKAATLIYEFDLHCKKHYKPRVRIPLDKIITGEHTGQGMR